MDFTLTPDQAAVADTIDRLARQFETKPTEFDGFALQSPELESELESGGYFDIATIPEMGAVTAALAVERLARSPYTAEVALSMLLRAGVPIHRSLVVASSAAGNAAMEEALTQEAERVLRGQTVAEALAESKVLPDMALDMIATAERSGSFEDALERIADYYESETDVGGKQTAIAVGMIFYLIVAAIIGFVVISFWGDYFSQYDSLLGP